MCWRKSNCQYTLDHLPSRGMDFCLFLLLLFFNFFFILLTNFLKKINWHERPCSYKREIVVKIYGYGLIQMYVSDKLTGQGGGRHTYISHIILFYSKQSKWIHITIQTYCQNHNQFKKWLNFYVNFLCNYILLSVF